MQPNGISFNSYSLQTVNIVTQSVSRDDLPVKQAQAFALSHSNKSAIPYVYYPSKTITVNGRIIGSGSADLDLRVDAFKLALSGTDQNLDIDYGVNQRRYIATLNSCKIDRTGMINYADFSISFFCTNPFGTDIGVTTPVNATNITTVPYSTTAFNVSGSAPVQRPKYTATLVAIGPTGSNLIVNTGFETDTSLWTAASGTFTRDTTTFNSGVASGKMVSGASIVSSYYGQVYYNLSGLTIGNQYLITVYAKGVTGTETLVLAPFGGTSLFSWGLTTAWAKYTYTLTATSTSFALALGNASQASATFYIDDIAVAAYGSGTVSISNSTTSQTLTVTRTWNPNDILIIDTLNKAVQVNGLDVIFGGAFPELKPGSGTGTVTYSDTFSSRTLSFRIDYNAGYL